MPTTAPPDPVSSLMGNAAITLTRTLIYGIFVLLYAQSAVAYRRKKQRSWAQFWMFLISTITFLLATVHEVALVAFDCLLIYTTFHKHQVPPLTMEDRFMENLPAVLLWIDNIHITINDATVVWRAFVLTQNRRWRFLICFVAFLPLLGFAGLLTSLSSLFFLYYRFKVTSVVYTIFKIPDFKVHGDPSDDVLSDEFAGARYGLSLGTNVIATATIGCVYWLHRKDMVAGLGNHRPTQVERVLVLLVESGFAFCIFQIANFILTFVALEMPEQYLGLIIWSGYVGLASAYPTMVIALVNSHRTLDQMYSTATSLRIGEGANRSEVATLHFAHVASSTSIPQEVKENKE